MEKLNARAKATASHKDCLVAAMMVMIRQNRLVITVRAFLSVRYWRFSVCEGKYTKGCARAFTTVGRTAETFDKIALLRWKNIVGGKMQ
jgi:hypothetical protein